MKMEQPKYREKVLIGLEAAPPSFDVRGKVLGPGGANLLYITKETGAVVTLRGKDSGFIEANGHESIEPLHICVEHSRYEVLQGGRQLAFNLIETVQQEWAFQKEQLHQQPPPAPQPTSTASSQLQQPPPTALAQAQGVQLHPSQILTSNPTVSAAPNTSEHQIQVATSVAQNGNAGAVQVQATLGGTGPVLLSNTAHLQQTTAVGGGDHAASAMLSAGDLGRPSPQPALQVQQPRQVLVSQQGSLIPQPTTTLIPQQQQVLPPGSLLTHQPHIIQASYPVQYMQTSNGQMVLAYPNIVRPVLSSAGATAADPSGGHQVMLVQYGQAGAATAGLRPTLHPQALRATQPMLATAASPVSAGGALAPPQLAQHQQSATAATIPQIVQIVNPQTGQIQHVIQHIQPQLHMQQVQLGGSVGGAAGTALLGHQQVLMPVQQQLLTQLPGATAAAALQFGTAATATGAPHHLHPAAAQHQQLFIAQQVAQQQLQSVGLTHQQQQLLAAQTQVTSSSAVTAGLLSAQPSLAQLTQPPPGMQSQSQTVTTISQPVMSLQSAVASIQPSLQQQGQKRRYEGEQNQFQTAPPPPSHLAQSNAHQIRKGIGMEQRQQNQSSQQQHEQSSTQASADGSKALQQDEWRQRETGADLQGMRDLVEKLQQDQAKRARPYHNLDSLSNNSVSTVDQVQIRTVSSKGAAPDKPTTFMNYIQQQQQQQQQGKQPDGSVWQQVYQQPPPNAGSAVQYLQHQHLQHQHQVYQQPPPPFPLSPHQYNPWIVPQ